MKNILLIILSLIIVQQSYSQFDDEMSKTELYDKAVDLEVYVQMLAKDKLYLIDNIFKKQASKEFDYALAKISENINDLDLNITDPDVRTLMKSAKKVWKKLHQKILENINVKDFAALYFNINTFERLISDMANKMEVRYQLHASEMENYNDIQTLRKLIQKITISYYANAIGLNKSFMHEYQKNIKNVDEFIKENSNKFLNDPISGNVFSDIIIDWNFFRSNVLHTKQHNPKTVFSLSTTIDYKLKTIKDRYIQKMNDNF